MDLYRQVNMALRSMRKAIATQPEYDRAVRECRRAHTAYAIAEYVVGTRKRSIGE